jgi:hypothetical protein
MVVNMKLDVVDGKGVLKQYILNSKQPDVWGILRFDMVEVDSSVKPYSISYHPDRYADSKIPNWGCSCKGWVFHKKCKHLTTVSKLVKALN